MLQNLIVSLENIPASKSKCLIICSMNIRSIPKNLQYFQDTVLSNTSINFDFHGLTETRLDAHLTSLYELPGTFYENFFIIW